MSLYSCRKFVTSLLQMLQASLSTSRRLFAVILPRLLKLSGFYKLGVNFDEVPFVLTLRCVLTSRELWESVGNRVTITMLPLSQSLHRSVGVQGMTVSDNCLVILQFCHSRVGYVTRDQVCIARVSQTPNPCC